MSRALRRGFWRTTASCLARAGQIFAKENFRGGKKSGRVERVPVRTRARIFSGLCERGALQSAPRTALRRRAASHRRGAVQGVRARGGRRAPARPAHRRPVAEHEGETLTCSLCRRNIDTQNQSKIVLDKKLNTN